MTLLRHHFYNVCFNILGKKNNENQTKTKAECRKTAEGECTECTSKLKSVTLLHFIVNKYLGVLKGISAALVKYCHFNSEIIYGTGAFKFVTPLL